MSALLQSSRRRRRSAPEAASAPPVPVDSAPEEVLEDTVSAFDRVVSEISPALDQIGENVMLADLQLILRYTNPAATTTLQRIAPAVQDTFGLSVFELLGGSIHRMHKDPARVERILAEEGAFELPHKADFGFGGVTLRTFINELLDHRSGVRVGYIVNWQDITELVEEKERVDGLKVGLDSAGRAVEELNTAIASISSSAGQAADRALTAVDGTRAMEEGIGVLEERRAEIEAAAGAINKVADQTRLLALNATIEAARAGEAGRGFAIVASEVKDLAASTAEVTSEIGDKLEAIGSAIETLRGRVEQVVEDIDGISDAQTSIAGAVEEQGAVAGDIGRSIGDALDGL